MSGVACFDPNRGDTWYKADKTPADLSKALQSASQNAERPSSHPTTEQHKSQIRELESKQNAINKQINEAQANMMRREGELKEVKVERERVMSVEVGNELDLNARM